MLFKKKKDKALPQPEIPQEAPDRVTPIVKELKRISASPCIRIGLQTQEGLDIFTSKLGGLPYWDTEKPYPCDGKGTPLSLLLQINLDREKLSDERLPRGGMLQFFLRDDDDYGLDFDAPETQNSFRVVYHPQVNYAVTGADILALKVPVMPREYSPVLKECALTFAEGTDGIGMTAFNFDSVFRTAVKNATGEDTEESIYDYFTDEEYKSLGNTLMADGSKIFGYPFFTQSDPRECTADYEEYYDTLLLQLDSVYSKDKQWMIWGDCGIANFFINGNALKEQDFSRVLYNWDCY